MKTLTKTLLFFCFLMGSASYLQAQISYGARLGYTLSNFNRQGKSVSGTKSDEMIKGLDIGLLAEVRLTKGLTFQPELQFIQKGEVIYDKHFLQSGMRKLSYVHVPLLFKLSADSKPASFFMTAGPSLGWGLFYKRGPRSEEFNEENHLRRFELALNVGIGLSYAINKARIFLDMRYMLGMTNVEVRREWDAKNQGFSFGMGVLVDLKSAD
ncbi:MAG: porin family protein [Bacteroidota bacterium]